MAFGLTLALMVPFVPQAVAAGGMTLVLVPHCTEQTGCAEFAVVDGEHITTGQLAAGDILDLDVLVRGPDFANVRSVRSWINYDPEILEARSIEISPSLPSPTPGEQTIDDALGLVKIGGSTPTGFTSADTRIARVTFRVLEATKNTELSFDGYNSTGHGHTAVNGEPQAGDGNISGSLPDPPCFDTILGCSEKNTPLLSGEPTRLTVLLASASQSSSASSQSSTSQSSSSSSSFSQPLSSSSSSITTTGQGTTFGILQVQNVRVTTKDTVIFLGWQALSSAELAGYNVYYGTVSGRYIQRRSLPASSTSLVLRDLEAGTTYYLAVRAVNAQGEESVFSQEVSVTVGAPESSTSPMTNLPVDSGAVGGNPIEKRGGKTINGDTGAASIFLWLFLGSAFVGTMFAYRRQTSHVS